MRTMLLQVRKSVYVSIFIYFLLMVAVWSVSSHFLFGIVAYVSFFASLLAYGWLQDR